MLRAPRFRVGVLLLAIASLLIGPSSPAEAQVPEDVEMEALVTGFTDPPPSNHTLGVNRVSGPSQFRRLGIQATVVCTEVPSVNVVVLNPENNHAVSFWADDDITDGYGEVSATDETRQFEGTDPVSGNRVRVRIEETGRFHRLLGVVEVDLTLDVRVTNADNQQVCHEERLPFRIIFELFPQIDPPGGAGFTLVGIGRRHLTGALEDRASVARKVCGVVGPAFTSAVRTVDGSPGGRDALEEANIRISGDHRLHVGPAEGTPRGPGRGNFHPCPEEGQRQ